MKGIEIVAATLVSAANLAAAADEFGLSAEALQSWARRHPYVMAGVNRERRAAGRAPIELQPERRVNLNAADPVLVDRVVETVASSPNLRSAAEALSVTHAALSKWLQRNPAIKARCQAERENRSASDARRFRSEFDG